MKKSLSLLMCIVMLCTMFTCLSSVLVSAAETAPKSLVGKQLSGFDTENWDVNASYLNGTKLLAAVTGGTVSATAKDTVSSTGKWSVTFDLKFDHGYANYYNENASIKLGTTEIRIRNINNYGDGVPAHYGIELYKSGSMIASHHLGAYEGSVNGTYTFDYNHGVFSATFKGNTIEWTVGDSTTTTLNNVDDINDATVMVSITNNYAPAENRYIYNFALRGPVNGDVNSDDKVDSLDLLLAQQSLIGVANDVPAAACDNNYDDKLSATDIVSLKQHILGLGLMAHYEGSPVNIMCIGDSITAGAGTPSGWRYAFFERMYAAGANFRLVGSYTTTADFRLPEGYQGYSAVGGHKTADVVNSLNSYMSNDFDAVAMMIGINDSMSGTAVATTVANYKTILDAIYAKNPNALVYVSTMCPPTYALNDSNWLNKDINGYLPEIVDEYQSKGYAITYVNNVTGYNWSTDDYPSTDVVHPVEEGRAKIAEAFYRAMIQDILNVKKDISFIYDTEVKVKSMTLSDSELTLELGTAQTVTATVVPANAAVKTILWSSANSNVAKVDAAGKITAVSVGNTVITAKSLSGNVVKTVNVSIVPSTAVASTQLFKDEFANLNNWTNSSSLISINAGTAATGMTSSGATLTSKNTYTYNNGFELSFDYMANGNEGAYWDDIYGAVKYAGFEVRSVDCGRKVMLYVDDNHVATHVANCTVDYISLKLIYKDGVAKVYCDGELIITANVTATVTNSNIVYTHKQLYRNTSLDNLYLGSY